ncbi:hypothetical protein ACSAZK_16905 [Methanosarcina sp. Mfa9]|uniref:hypothetical protein n=1 Tax=Methanosarcina sp. Mfa9 TaxID=3439063 RepID=UPI003F8704C9
MGKGFGKRVWEKGLGKGFGKGMMIFKTGTLSVFMKFGNQDNRNRCILWYFATLALASGFYHPDSISGSQKNLRLFGSYTASAT